MTFYINPGELRTPVRIQHYVKLDDGDDLVKGSWVDLDNKIDTDPPKYIRCKWEPTIKGTQAQLSDSTQSLDYATVTVRYRPDISTKCQIVKEDITYMILAAGNPDQHKRWLQIEVKAALNE